MKTYTVTLTAHELSDLISALESSKNDLRLERSRYLNAGDTVGAGAIEIEMTEILTLRNRLRDTPANS